MDILEFQHYLLYRPINPTDIPVNVIALADRLGPPQAVVWDYRENQWGYGTDLAVSVLYANQERHTFNRTDRVMAESVTHHFTTVPLPSEAELTRICQEASPTRPAPGRCPVRAAIPGQRAWRRRMPQVSRRHCRSREG